MEITLEEKKILLGVARNSIESAFSGKKEGRVETAKYPLFNSLCGAFVTLTINNHLRGCVGYIISDRPLIDTIFDAARHAAFEDNRFAPLIVCRTA